jgi:hypothetical protein
MRLTSLPAPPPSFLLDAFFLCARGLVLGAAASLGGGGGGAESSEVSLLTFESSTDVVSWLLAATKSRADLLGTGAKLGAGAGATLTGTDAARAKLPGASSAGSGGGLGASSVVFLTPGSGGGRDGGFEADGLARTFQSGGSERPLRLPNIDGLALTNGGASPSAPPMLSERFGRTAASTPGLRRDDAALVTAAAFDTDVAACTVAESDAAALGVRTVCE